MVEALYNCECLKRVRKIISGLYTWVPSEWNIPISLTAQEIKDLQSADSGYGQKILHVLANGALAAVT